MFTVGKSGGERALAPRGGSTRVKGKKNCVRVRECAHARGVFDLREWWDENVFWVFCFFFPAKSESLRCCVLSREAGLLWLLVKLSDMKSWYQIPVTAGTPPPQKKKTQSTMVLSFMFSNSVIKKKNSTKKTSKHKVTFGIILTVLDLFFFLNMKSHRTTTDKTRHQT